MYTLANTQLIPSVQHDPPRSPAQVEAQLAAEAQARGIALDRLIEEMSRTQFGSEPRERVKSRTVAEAVDSILRLREETSLDGLKIKDLISEGRKY